MKAIAPKVDALLVIGAPNSSNSKRLVEVGAKSGCAHAALVRRADDIDWNWFATASAVGLTAGASAPETLVEEVVAAFRARFDLTVEEVRTATETVTFRPPRILREPAKAEASA